MGKICLPTETMCSKSAMRTTVKNQELLQPFAVDEVHEVGDAQGADSPHRRRNLVRLGLTNIALWDMDVVNPHNLANQIFRQQDAPSAQHPE